MVLTEWNMFFSLWKTWYLEALCWHNIHEQLVNVTSAPRAVSVSMSTAVCRVMWRQPAMRAPFRGLVLPYSSLIFIRPGISFSAISMALRPHSARLMSARREMVRRHVNSVSSSCLQPVFYIFYTSAIIFLLHVSFSHKKVALALLMLLLQWELEDHSCLYSDSFHSHTASVAAHVQVSLNPHIKPV